MREILSGILSHPFALDSHQFEVGETIQHFTQLAIEENRACLTRDYDDYLALHHLIDAIRRSSETNCGFTSLGARCKSPCQESVRQV